MDEIDGQIKKLMSPDVQERIDAIERLGELGGERAIKAIKDALLDDELDVRRMARGTLIKVHPGPLEGITKLLVEKVGGEAMSEYLINLRGGRGTIEERAARTFISLEKARSNTIFRRPGDGEVATLDSILRDCRTMEDVEGFERALDEAYERVKKKNDEKAPVTRMHLLGFVRKASAKKNELTSTRDIALDVKPKPPKAKKKMWQSARRRSMNG